MPVDLNASADTTSSATEEISSTNQTGAEQASQTDGAQSPEGASDTSAQSNQDPQQQAGDGSSTTPDTTLQAADTTAATKTPEQWQAELDAATKRISDLRSGYSKLKLQHDQVSKRFDGVDPDKYRQLVDRTEKQDLRPWDSRHPENRNWNGLVASWERHRNLIQTAQSPEEAKILRDAASRAFTASELQQLAQWDQHQRAEVARMASDPNAYRERIREEVMSTVRNELEGQRQEQAVVGWFQDQANAPKVEKYREFMVEKLNAGYPWGIVQELVEAKWAADSLQSRVGGAEKASAAARAQTSALKASAVTTRDAAQTPIANTDFWKVAKKWAEKQGLPTSHPRVAAYLDDLVKKHRGNSQ